MTRYIKNHPNEVQYKMTAVIVKDITLWRIQFSRIILHFEVISLLVFLFTGVRSCVYCDQIWTCEMRSIGLDKNANLHLLIFKLNTYLYKFLAH